MRIDRLLSIIVYLLNRDLVSAKELAERYSVSTRTIQRDIDAISYAGIPIMTVQGPHGGYGIMDTYKMDRQLMSVDDLFYIVTALSGIVSSTNNKKMEATAEKMKSLIPKHDEALFEERHQKLYIDLSMLRGPTSRPDLFDTIERGIDQTQLLEISYTNGRLETSKRIIEPMTIVFKWRSWYLFAYCRLREDYRIFRLSRIHNPRLLDKTFSRRRESVEEYFLKSETWSTSNNVDLLLAFDKQMEPLVSEFFFGNEIEDDDQGRLLVRASMPEDGWIYGMILSYGSFVEVLEPERIRNIIRDESVKIKEKYEKAN